MSVLAVADGSIAQANADLSRVVPGHYIVVLDENVENPGQLAQSQAGREGRIDFVYRHALKGYAAILSGQAVSAIRHDPRVISIEPDVRGGIALQSNPTGIRRVFATANKALAINEKDDLRANVDVAVLDTGIDYLHADLNVVARTDCSNGALKYTECLNESGTDENSHGTHVSGTIAALDNGVGVAGVAPGARLWAVKVLDSGGFGELSEFIAGIDWITAHANEIEVANASLRYFVTSSEAFSKAMESSIGAGVVYVFAAGNESETVKYIPGNYANAITVSAIADFDGLAGSKAGATSCRTSFESEWGAQTDDALAKFSNFGSTVDIAAPGVCILSTVPGGGYAETGWSGTSMASPHVAGAAAILAAQSNPNSKSEVEAIRTKLVNAGNKGWTDTSGDGIQEPLLDVSSESTFWVPRWVIEATANASGAQHTIVEDMACEPSGISVCTAVGKQTSSGGVGTPYAMLRLNGFGWASQTTGVPAGTTDAELQAVHCLSGSSCVAAGYYTTSAGTFSLVEALSGSSWAVQTTPNPVEAKETHLKGISCKEITACIAVGYSGSGSTSSLVAMRGNSGTWTLQAVPLPTGVGATGGELTGVECNSASSCVAVGRYYLTATTYWAMISTWNGTSWTSVAAPKPPEEPKRSTLLDISCSSASSCTAVGGSMNKSGTQVTYVVKWNGTSWSWQTSPNPVGSTNTPLQNVSCVASSPCVAVGDWLDSSGVWRPMAQYWNGTAWVIEPVEIPSGQTFGLLAGIACRSTCLSVGWYTDAAGNNKTLGETRKWPS
ncbi:MAG TPA: S8 family serine peptidase [Solirubrobacterales bacterium]|nr:S8 family serine peptidase [Solirubrobacterales bacterium]